ncbi:hypothetical protein HDV62DRAFT_251468 [Trichoderma sp. SZMC 28011]
MARVAVFFLCVAARRVASRQAKSWWWLMTYNMDKELREESMPFSQSVYYTNKTVKTNNASGLVFNEEEHQNMNTAHL